MLFEKLKRIQTYTTKSSLKRIKRTNFNLSKRFKIFLGLLILMKKSQSKFEAKFFKTTYKLFGLKETQAKKLYTHQSNQV